METKKYKFGNVFNTEAVVEDITSEKENKVLFLNRRQRMASSCLLTEWGKMM